jgi:UDP-N-acetylmuramoyl-tripeptide--D-alanyl-D-alanine ligase
MLVSILGGSREVLKTPASHNNEVGVPLAVLALSPETDVAVLELAMRGPGQIAYLADICRPSVGVITNVGPSHLEFFADDAEIAAVKAELLAALPPDGAAVLNMDDRYFDFFRERSPAPVISFGISDAAAVRGVDVEPLDGWSWQFRLETAAGSIPIALRVPGRHQVSNALAAAAAALRLGASLEEVRAGLEAYTMVSHRVNLLASVRGITVIDDCYNASPVSMAAALDLLAGAPAARRIAVLGDMRELGEQTESFHRDLGGLAARVPVDRLVTVGELGALIAEGARVELASLAVETCADNAAAIETLLADMRPGDVVLVKGSRAMGMEEIVARLMAE